jgi:hypothetical protein
VEGRKADWGFWEGAESQLGRDAGEFNGLFLGLGRCANEEIRSKDKTPIRIDMTEAY